MGRKIAAGLTLVILFAALASCGSDSLLLSMGRDTSDLEINSLPDGQVVAPGSTLPLELSSRDAGSHGDLEVQVSLTSPTGAAIWKHEPLSSPAVNEDLALALPDLPAGQYQLEIVVLSRGEQIRKRVSSLFLARDSYAISGIKSFPPVITTGSTVLLKAELAVPDGSDPYLRWTWKGKLIARGLRSGGAAQALWSAPAEEGVYSIHLELFPGAPATGADFTFSSSLIQSTDLYVTAGTHLARGDLSPEKSYWSLMHLQGNLADAGAGAKPGKSDASPIGSPQVVQVADGFGYRLDGRSGISIPWLILPVEAGALAPFTITMGITPESFESEQTILAVTAAEAALSLLITVDPVGRAPAALLTTAGHPSLAIPWQGPELQQDRRSVVSLSITPHATGLRAAWFLDGIQVSRLAAEIPLGLLEPGGKAVLGGENGFVGIVDELGVFYRDDQGKASTDPDLFARAARAAHGDSLVLANGFDGPFLPDGFVAEDGAGVDGGSLVVPAGAGARLPPLAVAADDVAVSLELAMRSAQAAVLALSWEGGSSPSLEVPLAEESGAITFTVTAGAAALSLPSAGGRAKIVKIPPAPSRESALLLRLSEPRDAKLPLLIDAVLATRQRQ